jgi:hypothetical protein
MMFFISGKEELVLWNWESRAEVSRFKFDNEGKAIGSFTRDGTKLIWVNLLADRQFGVRLLDPAEIRRELSQWGLGW